MIGPGRDLRREGGHPNRSGWCGSRWLSPNRGLLVC